MQVPRVGKATRYAYEDGCVIHCPDAVTLQDAATLCQIPSVSLVKVSHIEYLGSVTVIGLYQRLQ